MTNGNFDTIILISVLLLGSILFQKNQKHYAEKIESLSSEIKISNIQSLQEQHLELHHEITRSKVHVDQAIGLSNAILDVFENYKKHGDSELALIQLRRNKKIKAYLPIDHNDNLGSLHAMLTFLIAKVEETHLKHQPKNEYPLNFVVLIEDVLQGEQDTELKIAAFESYTIPEGHLTSILNHDTLEINKAPTEFCYSPSNVEFFTNAKEEFIISNSTEPTRP